MIKSWKLLLAVVILLFVGTGLAQEQVGRKLYPVDESHLDPSFAEFRARLLEVVERQDLDFLLSIIHLDTRLSIASGSREERQKNWEIFNVKYSRRAWQDLRDMLSLGVVRDGSEFCAPYFYNTFLGDYQIIEKVVITDSDVPIRAEAKSSAPIIDYLSYDVVKYLWRGRGALVWDTIEGEKYQWLRIET